MTAPAACQIISLLSTLLDQSFGACGEKWSAVTGLTEALLGHLVLLSLQPSVLFTEGGMSTAVHVVRMMWRVSSHDSPASRLVIQGLGFGGSHMAFSIIAFLRLMVRVLPL